jgi:hypothetical protein
MAKIHEEIIIIKLSKLVKDSNPEGISADIRMSESLLENLEQIVQELVGDGVIVEVEIA